MALVNHAKKEINAKIVYYGLAGSGKSTALSYIYSRIKPALRGELKIVPAGSDNLQFFDFSPFEAPLPNGYRVRLHVYTLTGYVNNPATWKMTLKGADGIMIMVNPAAALTAETKESVLQLRDFLSVYGVGLHETPAVLQLNSFSREFQPDSAAQAQLAAELDLTTITTCRSNAASGEGLLESLTTLSRQLLDRISVKTESSAADSTPAAPGTEDESQEPLLQELPVFGESVHNSDPLQIALLTRDVVAEGETIRIPIEIRKGDTSTRVVVTVNVALE